MSTSEFDQVVELVGRLSPREQLRLVAHIGARLSGAAEAPLVERLARGSPAAVLAALHAPPHVESTLVDELDREIQAGRVPPRYEGIFESRNAL